MKAQTRPFTENTFIEAHSFYGNLVAEELAEASKPKLF